MVDRGNWGHQARARGSAGREGQAGGPAQAEGRCQAAGYGQSGGQGRADGYGQAGKDVWVALMPWWHFAFVATVVATGAFAVAELPASGRLVALLVLYAALIVVYAATPGKFGSRTPRTVYLIGASSIFAAGCFLFPGASFLMFILIPQAFMMMGRRPAFVIVIGFALVSSGGELAYNGVSVATVATVGGSGVFTIAMSLLLGGYIGRIIEQSRQRASLIEELERTRSELAEVSRETGVLAERERLAREIHDALAQGFTSVIMLLQAATAALERGDVASAQHHLGLAEPAARDGLAEARSLISALAPLPLQGTSLVGAVERVCEELGSRLGFAVVFEVQGAAQALSHNAEIVLLRAAQVALVNVGRHSHAESARVRLVFYEWSTALEVVDDGVGFDPAKAAGFGLSQLRSRVSELGGTTVVDSACGNGTAVRVTVPNPGGPGQLPAARLSMPFPQAPEPGAGVAPTHVEIA